MLEINTDPLIEERLQNKVIPLKKLLKNNTINYNNFSVTPKDIIFNIEEKDYSKFEKLFFAKRNNSLNSFISQYNTFELDFKNTNNKIQVSFSKYGTLNINNSALNQSIEIVRRRIDDLGTKEPTILQRGEKRILVELPGIKNPDRVKDLLGKTAQLNFRLITDKKDDFGSEKMTSETGEEVIVNKKIIMRITHYCWNIVFHYINLILRHLKDKFIMNL